jgi:hypothetical protein
LAVTGFTSIGTIQTKNEGKRFVVARALESGDAEGWKGEYWSDGVLEPWAPGSGDCPDAPLICSVPGALQGRLVHSNQKTQSPRTSTSRTFLPPIAPARVRRN